MADPLRSLLKISGSNVEREVPLSDYTTWKVGGPARFMVTARSFSALMELLRIVREENLPLFVLGNGSNILVSDGGIQGVVLRLLGDFQSISSIGGGIVKAGSGALMGAVVAKALRVSLSGLEFAFGIPGTAGGAVMTNAGAFGGSIAEVLSDVTTVTGEGEVRQYTSFWDLYRSPLVPTVEVVTGAEFQLAVDGAEKIRERVDSIRARRKREQPQGAFTAGSVFKNPPGESAGRLIEECGLKGKGIGGAKISGAHANFIINEEAATASDIKDLIDLARHEVEERFGIRLELEVQTVGFEEE